MIFGRKKDAEEGFLTEIDRQDRIKKDFGIAPQNDKKEDKKNDKTAFFSKNKEEIVTKEEEIAAEQLQKYNENNKNNNAILETKDAKNPEIKNIQNNQNIVSTPKQNTASTTNQNTASITNQKNTDNLNTPNKIKNEELLKNNPDHINSINNTRRIYTLNGLPPEVVAVTFAKCSRSPEAFDVISKELNEDLSRKFHERWIVGYGHSSVAEHAILSIAIENVSILATKVLEDNRLASYTEKSTRYQVFDINRYYRPVKIMNSKHAELYVNTCNMLIDVYTEMFPKMLAFVKSKNPKTDDVDQNLYEVRMKAKALDNVRYILPVGVLTNLGLTINARQLEHAITKLISSPLDEMKEIGVEIKEAALKVTPTLVKYANYNEYIAELPKRINFANENLKIQKPDDSYRAMLVEYDRDAEDKVVASLLYGTSNYSYQQIKERIKLIKNEEKIQIIDAAVRGIGKFDSTPREFENTYYTFDILMDYGAFRDIQRHRICTQLNQKITTNHNYSLPGEIIEAKLEKEFIEAMKKAKDAYDTISKEFPEETAYLVPLAYKKRVLMTMNLREVCHFVKLRSGKMGHISYRRLAQQMWELVNDKHPLLARYIEVD
ncbi:MAG: FAD-dependent thymidylate synthase, partial [Nanoarchaeota archaeon]|nr:FAD-dependent thymidylate synthase [Nanoarchaeota archaeon]